MTDIDLDALEATARAATPGPWEADREHHTCYLLDEADCEHSDSPITERIEWHAGVDGATEDAVYHTHASYDSHHIAPDVAGNYDYESGGIVHTADAQHIAAFDPPTSLALIARLREAEAVIDAIDAIESMWPRGMYGCPQDMIGRNQIRAVTSRYKTTKTEGN